MSKYDRENDNMFLNPIQDSKKKSIVESVTDIIIGFAMYLPINFFILPMFAADIANQELMGFLQITAIFTTVSYTHLTLPTILLV